MFRAAAYRRRETESQRRVASHEHGQLGHPGSRGATGTAPPPPWRAMYVPPGKGVVEGNEIPYQPWALEKKKENFAKRMVMDTGRSESWRSRGQVLLARRAARHLYALSFSDHPGNRKDSDRIRIRPRRTRDSPGEGGCAPYLAVDTGWAIPRAAGRVRRWWSTCGPDRPDVVRSRRQLPQRRAARGGALHADRAGRVDLRSDHRGPEGVYAALEDEHAVYRHLERRQVHEVQCVEFAEPFMYGSISDPPLK